MFRCDKCGFESSTWWGSRCPRCPEYSAMDVATAALALVFGAALMWWRG